ncbi:hypothetical protein B0J13DRAFT_558735 [Dactylonectria estremocensis]|uniref:Zn(2)-C6 fungal-type domain-containing protein n=1 Tax=Dactylonectria estremocensis TaxID=1079267 RepID=A0A9P9EMU7_9HYPO|nr:hypothetical protein B0J13DRAFT_558735 [Dactylonectria estremocensis]
MADSRKEITTQPQKTVQKPKHSRTSTLKVRTGCITCKKRRVKCDEARPHCVKCLKSRGHCEGYAVELRKKDAPSQICWDSKQTVLAVSPRAQLRLDVDSSSFRGPQGALYFQEFVSLVQGPWITAASSCGFWAVTLPQLAHTNTTLRHAAMAIGALSVWHRQFSQKTLRAIPVPDLLDDDRERSYFHAVACYGHSLKLQHQQASPQDAVFLSLLLLYFEILRGNRKAALDHVNHGLALLFALLTDDDATDRHVAAFAPDPRPLLGAVSNVFIQLLLQTRTVVRKNVGGGPSLPNLAKGLRQKKQTTESFMMLLSELSPSSATIEHVPANFNDLDEFEGYWIACQRQHIKMMQLTAGTMRNWLATGYDKEAVLCDFQLDLLKNTEVKEFCENSRKAMRALDLAYLPLFNKIIMFEPESPTALRAIHLRLQYLGIYTFGDPLQYMDIELLCSRTHLFHEYLSVAKLALRTAKRQITGPAQQLSLQCGVSSYLLMLAFFCRDSLARHEAVLMLKDYPGQDGLLDSHSLYLLAARNLAVERLNATDDSVKEQWQRLLRREFVFEDGGDRIVFRYVEKHTATGEWGLVEETTDVSERSDEATWKRRPLSAPGGLLMMEQISQEQGES